MVKGKNGGPEAVAEIQPGNDGGLNLSGIPSVFSGDTSGHLLSKACPVTEAWLNQTCHRNTAQHDGKRDEVEVRGHSSTFPAG